MTSGQRGAPSPRIAAAMAGAVDLAAVKARSEAAARAAQAPAPDAAHVVVDVTEATFQAEVLDRSFQVPVIVDAGSDRAEASRVLTPTLRTLAGEAAGQWVLASVDVDANPRIAQALQVQSVPTVFAVLGGQLVPGFTGALPEEQVRDFIAAVLEAASTAGLSGLSGTAAAEEPGDEAEPPADPRFAAAEEALDQGDYDLAAQRYEAILAGEPANTEAALALRQTRFMARVERPDVDPAQTLQDAAGAPDDVERQLAASDVEVAHNDVEGAFARLLGLIRRLPGDARGPIRDRLVEYFDLLGPDDPRVAGARRELASALF